MNHSQYDVRCPVCRHQTEGVRGRPQAEGETFTATVRVVNWDDVTDMMRLQGQERTETHDAFVREWSRYTRRRRRLLQTRPELDRLFEDLKNLRREMNCAYDTVQRSFRSKSREIWREDPDILRERRAVTLLRRRENRLDRRLSEAFAREIGPEPIPSD